MATVYCEYGLTAASGAMGWATSIGMALHATCSDSETLAVGAGTVTGTIVGSITRRVARLTTDTDTWFAVGLTPDPTLTTATAASGAKRFLKAGATVDVVLFPGQKVAVRGLS